MAGWINGPEKGGLCYKALSRLHDNLPVLVADFKVIASSTNAEFKEHVRNQAERLEHRITSRDFIPLLMFDMDTLKILVDFCHDLQKKPGMTI